MQNIHSHGFLCLVKFERLSGIETSAVDEFPEKIWLMHKNDWRGLKRKENDDLFLKSTNVFKHGFGTAEALQDSARLLEKSNASLFRLQVRLALHFQCVQSCAF